MRGVRVAKPNTGILSPNSRKRQQRMLRNREYRRRQRIADEMQKHKIASQASTIRRMSAETNKLKRSLEVSDENDD